MVFFPLIYPCVCNVTIFPPIVKLHLSVYKPHTTHNSSICSDKGLMLKISALETVHGPIYNINLVDKTRLSDNLRNNIPTGYWDSKYWYTIQVHFFFLIRMSWKTFLICIESCVLSDFNKSI